MGKMDSILLKSKFRGSLLGTLIGDCLGSAYEGEEIFTSGMRLVIQKSFDKLEGPYFKAPVIQFTDDSAMTFGVAESLIENKGFDQKDMAKKFVKLYFKAPNRGYGAGVTTVFHKLRNNKFSDILTPAKEQFNGHGSLGNGGAMRVAPISLLFHKNYDLMVDTARKQSQITHTHKTGVDGAILQAIAIHQSLLLNPKEKLDICKFTDDLIEKMDKIETDEEGLDLVDPYPYKSQLKLVRNLICEDGDGPHNEKVVHQLGNDVSALHSVPTAIYCFLRAQKPIKDIQTENPLRRAVQYAHIMTFGYCKDGEFWSDDEIHKLVYLYKKFPCLWNRDISSYEDNVARHYAYRNIHESIKKIRDVTFTDIMIKIREIRRSYINELKNLSIAKDAGYSYEPESKWFYPIHKFLYPYLEYRESADLNKIGSNVIKIDPYDCKTVSKTVKQDNRGALASGDPRREDISLFCKDLHDEQNSSSSSEEQCSPVDFSELKNVQNCNLNSSYQSSLAPVLNRSRYLSPEVKNGNSKSWRIHISRNMNSPQLCDYREKLVSPNQAKLGVQFILSKDSLISDESSSTIVCGKRSDYTCTTAKSFADCGVQWKGPRTESSAVACNTLSVGKETRDSAISVEYDEDDIFAKSIACYLKEMDIETSLKAKNQIRKVIDDHRLHKPETQSIRLLRPEISEKRCEHGKTRRRDSRIEKSHCVVTTTRTIKGTHLPRSGREFQHTVKPDKDFRGINTVSLKDRELKLEEKKKASSIIEPIITHYERSYKASISKSGKLPTTTNKIISLGGDTDTIGSMAGAIAGAFHGDEMIRQEILKHCESSSEFTNLADKLYELVNSA